VRAPRTGVVSPGNGKPITAFALQTLLIPVAQNLTKLFDFERIFSLLKEK